jgi:hypothetical protein
VGIYAILERLSAWQIGRGVLQLFGAEAKGYCVPWDKLDLSDPSKPRLKCRLDELPLLK